MNLKSIPLILVSAIAASKIIYSFDANNILGFCFSIFYSLAFIQISWAFWKGKDMLAPPNFDYKNGTNEGPRSFFVGCMVICFLMVVFQN